MSLIKNKQLYILEKWPKDITKWNFKIRLWYHVENKNKIKYKKEMGDGEIEKKTFKDTSLLFSSELKYITYVPFIGE